MNTVILAWVISFFLPACATNQIQSSSEIRDHKEIDDRPPVRLEATIDFPGLRGVTVCGDELLVVAERTVWNVVFSDQAPLQKTELIHRLSARDVRFVACRSDDELYVIEPGSSGGFSASISNREDDTYRMPTNFYFPSLEDFRQFSMREVYFSHYMYGRWYVTRGVFEKKSLKKSLISRGRFPVGCGQDCAFFLASTPSGVFEIRRFQNEEETTLVRLSRETPIGLEQFDNHFVVAYPDRLTWPQKNQDMPVSQPPEQLLVWQGKLVVVSNGQVHFYTAR